MTHTAHPPKTASPRTRLFALLSCLLLGALVFTAAPALAAAPEEPTTLSPAKSITGTSAIFEGVLNPHSKATVGGMFAYSDPEGLTCLEGPQAGLEGFEAEKEVQAQTVHARVALEPKRTYKFCLVATNEGGIGVTPGNEVSVTTPAIAPTVEGEGVSGLSDDGATPAEARVEAAVNANNEEVTKCEFQYGTDASLATSASAPCEQATLEGVYGPQAADVSLSGLTAKTKYYYRVVATNATGASKGTAIESFTTPLHPETPETGPASAIAANTATLNGVLNHAGARESEPGDYEFRYRQSASECQGEGEKATTPPTAALGHKEEAATTPVSGLLPHTEYTFCLLATNEVGEISAPSAPVTFTTLAAAPTVELESEFATEVTSDSATLHATVNPQGAETSYIFEYAPAGGAFKPVSEPEGAGSLPEGTSGVALSVHVQHGLAADASYEFRVVVSNAVENGNAREPVAFTTQAAATGFTLPDGRQYELVTPPAKEGARFFGLSPFYDGETFGYSRIIQASAAGDAIADQASQSTEGEAQGNSQPTVPVLSTRGPAGWSSQVISPSHPGPSVVTTETELPLFSEDLSHALVEHIGPFTPLSPEASESTPYLRTDYFNGDVNEHCDGSSLGASSCFQPLVTRADDTASPFQPFGECINHGEPDPGYGCGPLLTGASANLSHVVVSSSVQLTAVPSRSSNGLYEWSGGQLQLVSVFPTGETPPGDEVQLAGYPLYEAGESAYARRAVSEDGERVVFLSRAGTGSGPAALYLRDVGTEETFRLDLPEAGAPGASSGTLKFMTASTDASRIFFLDGAGLTTQPSAPGEDLYEYAPANPAGERLTDLSADPKESADVQEVLGTSDDGSYVYFAAGGALTPNAAADPGECPRAKEQHENNDEGCNIYVRHDGVTRLIAAGWIASDKVENEFSRVAPDGRWLAFMSSSGPTGYDNRDAVSGEPDAEVYLYHAPEDLATEVGSLACASCNPTGVRPTGALDAGRTFRGWAAANVPGMPHSFGEGGFAASESLYQPRYLSGSGRLFFESDEALVPQDVDGSEDVYEYEPAGVLACSPSSTSGSEVFKPAHAFTVKGVSGEEGAGCVALISSGTSSEPSSFLDASETGGDVFILTSAQLTSANPGGANVYDAHECTGESPCISSPEAPPACITEASCKPSPEPQPSIYGLPSSATFSGPGNQAPAPAVVKAVTKKTVRCKKGLVRNKRGRCVKKVQKKARRSKRASNDRRAK
jgi:hypothetical protein